MSSAVDISKDYTTPPHPTAFSGPGRVKNYYGNVSRAKVDDELAKIDSYTLFREYKKPKTYNPFYVYFKRQQVQMDLVDISKFKKRNDSTTFILTAIDCLTKRAWIRLLSNKKGETTLKAIKSIMTEMGQQPETVFFDRGKEFVAKIVRDYFKSKNIEVVHPNSKIKAAIVERFNKSLQSLIYKHMSENQTTRYVDKIDDILAVYNNRVHRTIKMTPNEADKNENQLLVRNAMIEHYAKIEAKRKKPKFKVGDMVRIKTDPAEGPFSRSYHEQFSREFFTIIEVKTRMPIPQYVIRSLNDGETIQGGFYSNELTKVSNDVFKVEKVLDTRFRNKKKQLLIRWLGFSDEHNSWEDEDNIVRNYDGN